jgi:long-chain acyl-CoA synthetase
VVGSGQDYVGALLFPDFGRLQEWAQRRGLTGPRLTEAPEVRELFASELEKINPLVEVKYQRIRRAVLADRELSLERGELTPSAKIVRQRVCDSFARDIRELFADEPANCVIQIKERQLQGA